MRREILPNAMPPLVAEFGLRFCFVFLFIASLSFLGLGIQPPPADWGGMVRENAGAITFGIDVDDHVFTYRTEEGHILQGQIEYTGRKTENQTLKLS